MGQSLRRGGRNSIRGEKRIWVLEGPPLEDIVDIEESLAPLDQGLCLTEDLNLITKNE